MERLTPEQIRLLEELRELRDSGILTVDEFEFQVAKVLGRPLLVESLPVDEELSAPEDTPVAELLEYEFVEPNVSDEEEILAEENQGIETLPVSDITASSDVESEPRQNNSSRRKVLVGTTVSLALVAVGTIVALIGGGKSDSTSSQIVSSTTTVTENASTDRTDAPTSPEDTQVPAPSSQSGATTTAVFPNAASGNAGRPTTVTTPITTPITTPLTTVVDSDSLRPMVTDLQISKSHSVFYDFPLDLQQTVTFTATILNDAIFDSDSVWIVRKASDGLGGVVKLSRVQPGKWKATIDAYSQFGVYEFCVRLRFSTCEGPSASYEVLEQERNGPTISDVTISPATMSHGDTVTVSVRVVDVTGVSRVSGTIRLPSTQATCGNFSLISGHMRDGLWSFECVLTTQAGQGEVIIMAWDINFFHSEFRYPITVSEPVLNGLETARN